MELAARQSWLTCVARSVHRAVLRIYQRLIGPWRYNRLTIERVDGRPLLILPQVFNPKLLRTGVILAQVALDQPALAGATVLDMGTGSGIGAVYAARKARRVVAVDINPEAVRCARLNALLQHVDDQVEVRQGDLFAPVFGERFELILFNPPFFRGRPRDLLDYAWRSEDAVERFAVGLDEHLRPGGRALVLLSSDSDEATFLRAFQTHGLRISVTARRNLWNETITIYCLERA